MMSTANGTIHTRVSNSHIFSLYFHSSSSLCRPRSLRMPANLIALALAHRRAIGIGTHDTHTLSVVLHHRFVMPTHKFRSIKPLDVRLFTTQFRINFLSLLLFCFECISFSLSLFLSFDICFHFVRVKLFFYSSFVSIGNQTVTMYCYEH